MEAEYERNSNRDLTQKKKKSDRKTLAPASPPLPPLSLFSCILSYSFCVNVSEEWGHSKSDEILAANSFSPCSPPPRLLPLPRLLSPSVFISLLRVLLVAVLSSSTIISLSCLHPTRSKSTYAKKEKREINFLFLSASIFFFNTFLLLHLCCCSIIVKEGKNGHHQVIQPTLGREVQVFDNRCQDSKWDKMSFS
jgi:hypothetical protein